MLNIGGLKNGVVIDHIQAGRAMKIYEYLELEKLDCSVAIIKNAKSNKMGKKDIIKIEEPNIVNLDINIIKDETICKKYNPTSPKQVTNIIRCKNPRCITSIELELPHQFKLTDPIKGVYRCVYCEQKFKRNK